MVDNGKNQACNIDVRGTKFFSVISLYLAISWVLSLILYKSKKPELLANYTVSWLILIGVALLVLGAISYFNYMIWFRFGRRGENGLQRAWGSWLFILLLTGLVWLVVGGLIYFHGNLNEKGLVNFNDQVVVLGLACSLALITFLEIPALLQSKFLTKMQILLSKTWFHRGLLIGLLVFFVFLSIYNGIFWQGMVGDETLDVYAARTIADGNGPFAEYIILHPPMAYLPTALFILIGRLISLETLIAVRVGKLVVFLFSTILVYLSANKLTSNRVLALFGAALIGWTSVFTLIAFNSPTKLYVVFFNLALILLIQYEKWFWVGFTSLALVLSWGGGFLFLPIPFVILFFGEREGAFRRWSLMIGGLLAAALLLVLYLYSTGTLDLFYSQYIAGTYELLFSKLGPPAYTYATAEMGLFVRLRFMSGVDRFILYLSIAAVLYYLHARFSDRITKEKIRWLLSNPIEAPFFLSFVFVLVLSLVDFQSFLDAIPVVVPASLLLLAAVESYLAPSSGHSSESGVAVSLRIILIMLMLGIARTLTPVKTSPVSLDAQKTASSLIDEFAPEASFQYLGHLGPLILRNEDNPSRVIHLGPKTILAMEAEGQSLTDFLVEISEKQPDYIVVDPRNQGLDYLQPVFEFLDQTYELVENPYSNLENRRIYYQANNPVGQMLAYGLIESGQNPGLMKAALAGRNDDLKTALASYREAILANWRVVNFSQLEMGKLRYERGQADFAEANFDNAMTMGPYKAMGELSLGTFFQSVGDVGREQMYYAMVFNNDIPESFEYRGPEIYGPLELSDVENSINHRVSDTHFITGYELTEADPDQVLLTLWWYLPDHRGKDDAMVAIRWVDESGEPIREADVFRTMFYPELGVRWSYLIDKDVVDHAAGFQINLIHGNAMPEFGEAVFIQRP